VTSASELEVEGAGLTVERGSRDAFKQIGDVRMHLIGAPQEHAAGFVL
jgi:hypothetical protein